MRTLLLDLGLPRRAGLEVLAAARSRGDRTPILILTARRAAAPVLTTQPDTGAS